MKILITGGAGFIGTHLARRALREGATVTVLDNFGAQVHGDNSQLPADLRSDVRLISADVEDASAMSAALLGQDVVVHLAAETGTGQSMYEVRRYEQTNIGGTAVLFDLLVNDVKRSVRGVVVASSRAIYGEGKYRCDEHGHVYPFTRTADAMARRQYEPVCPICGAPCTVAPTDEDTPARPSSFYGLTKLTQEQMTLLFAEAMGISAFALRYQNVYGPGQSLKNPYTGVLAVFSNLARENKAVRIFEDGRESRDFVFVSDVVDATWRSVVQCHAAEAPVRASLNVGSGVAVSIADMARQVVAFFGSSSEVLVTGDYRIGDIRHNFADLRRVSSTLGFEPQVAFEVGLREFLAWACESQPDNSGYERSLAELRSKGLMSL